MDAGTVIAALGLEPHPEGGHYRELFRDRPAGGGRGAKTSIYYLLRAGEASRWHRVTDAVEVWHFHAGGALELCVSADGRTVQRHRLGVDFAAGERPQAVVPKGAWQSARPVRGEWVLVGCTVAPAFEFTGFELAPPGWVPGGEARQ